MADAPIPVKTRDQLIATLKAGEHPDGVYGSVANPLDRPIVLWHDMPNMIGHPVRGAKLNFASGPGIITGWSESKPPLDMWLPDGGLRLRDSTGVNWWITIPNGTYSHPGPSPRFWGDLTSCQWDMDFSLAAYSGPQGQSYPLFGLYDQFAGASPIMVLATGSRLTVHFRDGSGLKNKFDPKVLDSTPGARNRISIRYVPGKLSVTGPLGTFETAIEGKLVENIDAAFQINNGGHGMWSDPIFLPGDLTLHAFNFSHAPGFTGVPYTQPLKIPAKGDWWLGKGAILHNPVSRGSWSAPPARIENIGIRCHGRNNDGAAIAAGYSGQGLKVRNVRTGYHMVGISSLGGPSYWHAVTDWIGSGHSLAGVYGHQIIIKLDDVIFDRNGRDDVCMRGGGIFIDHAMVTAGGNGPLTWRQTSFRFPPWYDSVRATIKNLLVDDEGSHPMIANILADCSLERFGNGIRIVLEDSYFAEGSSIAVLTGTPKVAGAKGYFELRNVTSLTRDPTVVATPSWEVVGKIAPRLDVIPGPVVNKPA